MNFLKDSPIRIKLAVGFGILTVLLFVIVIVNIWQLRNLATRSSIMLEQRIPTMQASMDIADGIQQALAALRGYMLLGETSLKDERNQAWSQTIFPAWSTIQDMANVHSTVDAGPQTHSIDFEEVDRLLKEFQKLQETIESLAHSDENIPAIQVLFEEASPLVQTMNQNIATMIELESREAASAERKTLLAIMAEFQGTLGLAFASIRGYLISGDKNLQEEFHRMWKANGTWFNQLNQRKVWLTVDQNEALQKLTEGRSNFAALPQRMFDLRSGDDWNRANYLASTEAVPMGNQLRSLLKEQVQLQTQTLQQEGRLIESLVNTLQWIEWALLALGLAVAILFGTFLTRSITRPLTETVKMLNSLSQGHLEYRVPVRSQDEIGKMSQTMNAFADDLQNTTVSLLQRIAEGDLTAEIFPKDEQDVVGTALRSMNNNLNGLITQVASNSSQVSQGASQVASSSESLSQGATEQASALEQIASSMTELNSQTSRNAEHASHASSLAFTASTSTQEGNAQMKHMVQAMGKIEAASQDISKIIKVIDEIAFQTNLLAINAAVEAARAGNHGKGFAVVAEEVRNLAQRSAESARETTELIEESVAKVKEGQTVAHKTAAALEQILGQVEKVNDIAGEIADASKQQAMGIEQINRGLRQLQTVTQQTVQVAEESAAASHQLTSQSQQMTQLVNQFRLRDITLASNIQSTTSTTL